MTQSITQKIKLLASAFALVLLLLSSAPTYARPAPLDPPPPTNAPSSGSGSSTQKDCTETNGTCFSCNGGPNGQNCDLGCKDGTCSDPLAKPNANCKNNSCDLILKYVNPTINLFSILFGLVAVISLILGGIQFSTSEGDPQKANNAKSRITKTIVAIIAYFFMFSLLQFLVPGGLFNRN
jgi:hypothetical protein